MRLTRYTDYALRTLIYVGLREPGQSSIAEVARAYAISESHLTKVVHRLGQLGLVRTTRGRGGGLRLGRDPADIVVGAVVRQTEDDMALVDCFGSGACTIAAHCRLRTALGEALDAFLAVLDRHTLADLIGGDGGRDVAMLLGLEGPPSAPKPVRPDPEPRSRPDRDGATPVEPVDRVDGGRARSR